MDIPLWREFLVSPAFGAIVALIGVGITLWASARSNRTVRKTALEEARRERLRGWILDLQDALTQLMAVEMDVAAHDLSSSARLPAGAVVDIMTLTGRVNAHASRVRDAELKRLVRASMEAIVEIGSASTVDELGMLGNRARESLRTFDARVAALLEQLDSG